MRYRSTKINQSVGRGQGEQKRAWGDFGGCIGIAEGKRAQPGSAQCAGRSIRIEIQFGMKRREKKNKSRAFSFIGLPDTTSISRMSKRRLLPKEEACSSTHARTHGKQEKQKGLLLGRSGPGQVRSGQVVNAVC